MTLHSTIHGLMIVAVCLGLSLTGCGGPAGGTVSGKLILDGETYTDASVIFLSLKTGSGSSAGVDAEGRFTLPEKLAAGIYQVYIAPPMVDNDAAMPTAVLMDKRVPDKYWSESSTDIQVEIIDGQNEVEVALQSR
jgi:hypothetical protein